MDQTDRELIFRKRLRLWFLPFCIGCLMFALVVFAIMISEWGKQGRLEDAGTIFFPWCLAVVTLIQNRKTLRTAASFSETRLAFGIQWMVCSLGLFGVSKWIDSEGGFFSWSIQMAGIYRSYLGSLVAAGSPDDFGMAAAAITSLVTFHVVTPVCWMIALVGSVKAWRSHLGESLNSK